MTALTGRSGKLLALVVAALLAHPAAAGWNGAEWGMTPREVEAATGGMARMVRENLPREGRRRHIGNRGRLQSDLAEFELRYRFDHTGLVEIELTPEFEDCDRVYSELVATYGEAKAMTEDIILRTRTWQDLGNDLQIVLIHSTAQVCEINFMKIGWQAGY